MTEGEAKTKPCIGPAPHNTGMPANPNAYSGIVYACAGSACIAWRWSDAFPFPNDPPAISERYYGFCGLAGKL